MGEVPAGADVLRRGGTYLITGGLGSVGLTLAGMLTRRYGAKVGLVSRRAFPAPEAWNGWLATHAEDDEVSRQIRKLQSMAESDGEVLVLKADIADPGQTDEALVQLRKRWGALHGVFHAAGLVTGEHNSVIGELTRRKIAAQFAAKVHGTPHSRPVAAIQ